VTLKQVVDVLLQRKWLILVVLFIAVGIAAVYLQVQAKSFTSTIAARTSVSVTTASLGGELGGVQVDFDPSTITSSKVLKPAAKTTGVSEAALSRAIAYDVQAGAKTNTIEITATAVTPNGAQREASAVLTSYTAYLQKQIESALATLSTRQQAATAKAISFQQAVTADPKSAIAAANLTSALSDLGELNNQIESIRDSGSPLTLLAAAPLGTPVGLSTFLVLALALTAGLIAGIGVALIRDQFDNRLRGEHEIEPLTSLPSLGELRYDRTLARRNEVLPAASGRQTPLGEGLRSLRTSMQVLLPRHGAAVVFTSVEPSDGKTFVSANIALTLARAGKKVILVGGDLRRPTLARYFGDTAGGAGLAELLHGATAANREEITPRVEASLKETDYAGLRLLPAGFDSTDAADLLAKSSLKDVVDTLRTLADIVIIDSPPAMALVDASLLAEHTDGVIILASVNRTNRSFLVETVDLLRQNGVTTLGVVANRSRRSLPRSYSPYYIRQDQTKPAGKPTQGEQVSAPVVSPQLKPETATGGEDRSAEAKVIEIRTPRGRVRQLRRKPAPTPAPAAAAADDDTSASELSSDPDEPAIATNTE
jgi:capsular exopolysaccharide synthesis family protein